MTLKTINIGGQANDGTGDSIRSAFDKINENFSTISSGGVTINTTSSSGLASITYVDMVVASSTMSFASSLQGLHTEFTALDAKTSGSYTNLVTLISNSTSTIATHINTLEARFNSLSTGTGATISYVDTAIASSTASIASSLQSLQTNFTNLQTQTAGSYTNLVTLISNSTGTIASDLSILNARFNSLSTGTGATVSYVDTAIANSTASIARSLQTLQTNFTNLQTQTVGSYTNLVTLISNSTGTLATKVSTLETNYSSLSSSISNKASVSYVDTAVANSTSSLASRVVTLEARAASASTTTGATIAYVDTAVANSTGTLATKVTTLETNYSSLSSTVSGKASVSYVDTAVSNASGSLASSISSVSSTVGSLSSTVSTLSSSIDGVKGQWGVTINSNGAVSGIKLLSGGSASSAFIVSADTFKVSSGSNSITPFSVDTVKNAVIVNNGLYVHADATIPSIGYTFSIDGMGIVRSENVVTIGAFEANNLTRSAQAIRGTTSKYGYYGVAAYNAYGNTGQAAFLAYSEVTGKRFQAGGDFAAASLSGDGQWKCTDGVIPFTGIHEILLLKNSTAVPGDIIIDTGTLISQSISSTLSGGTISTTASQKGAVGVFNSSTEISVGTPSAMWVNDSITKAPITEGGQPEMRHVTIPVAGIDIAYYADTYNVALINAIGDGQINVCGANGNIEIGDLITTSTIPGKGMKQLDDLVRATTVAKARQNVTFSSPDEVKMISCIYMCG